MPFVCIMEQVCFISSFYFNPCCIFFALFHPFFDSFVSWILHRIDQFGVFHIILGCSIDTSLMIFICCIQKTVFVIPIKILNLLFFWICKLLIIFFECIVWSLNDIIKSVGIITVEISVRINIFIRLLYWQSMKNCVFCS